MTVIQYHDSIENLRAIYLSKEAPKVRLEQVRAALLDESSYMGPFGKLRLHEGHYGAAVGQAASHETYMMGQQAWGLFNPLRSGEASAWALTRFETENIAQQIRHWMHELVTHYSTDRMPASMDVALFPADSGNMTTIRYHHGFQGFGGGPGWIVMQIWPDDSNLQRLTAMLTRYYAWQLRQAALDNRAATTLADFIVAEGLAAYLIAQTHPEMADKAWMVSIAEPAGWDNEERKIAAYYKLQDYSDVMVNVYGSLAPVGPQAAPDCVPLDEDELEYSIDVIAGALDSESPTEIAAHLYGDLRVAIQGHYGVGLPNYAGFQVGYEVVRSYLANTGMDIRQAMLRPSAEIIQACGIMASTSA